MSCANGIRPKVPTPHLSAVIIGAVSLTVLQLHLTSTIEPQILGDPKNLGGDQFSLQHRTTSPGYTFLLQRNNGCERPTEMSHLTSLWQQSKVFHFPQPYRFLDE